MSLANWTTRFLVGGTQGDRERAQEAGTSSDGSGVKDATTVNPDPQSLVGTRVGAYLITKRIGAGGVGQVFKGVDTMLKREVAIKVLRDELASDPVFLARFRNEAQLQAKLSHPNVASVHAFMQEGDKQLMVMEYVAGIGLDEFVRSGGPVPVARALNIFRRALDGVEHAHGHGIVHRDIKPANIMLADSGQVKVMDFGIARAMDSQEHLTRHGHVAGTAKAMSPEQIRGKQADVRSDVYSLGIVLYTLLSGRAPFDSGNDMELMKAQLDQPPPPLRGLVDDLPPKIEAAVMRALEKDPSARFQTVRDFARVIDACLSELANRSAPVGDRPLDAPTASRTAINPVLQGVNRLPAADPAREAPIPMPGRTSSPKWMRLGAVALAVAALAGGGGLLWSHFSPADEPSEPPIPIAAATNPQIAQPTPQPQQPVPQPQQPTPPAATPNPEPASVQTSPGVSPPMPVAAAPATPPPPVPAPSSEPARLPTLAIVRLRAAAKAGTGAVAADDRFQPGERVRLLVKSGQDAHVYCYLQDKSRHILRFYPNRFTRSALVRAAEPLEIPGKMRFELVADSLKATETVACFAYERDLAGELPATVVGDDFAKLPVASLDEVRDAFSRAAAETVAESRFRIEVR